MWNIRLLEQDSILDLFIASRQQPIPWGIDSLNISMIQIDASISQERKKFTIYPYNF